MKYAFVGNVSKETKREIGFTLELMGVKEYLFSDVAFDRWKNLLPGYYGFYLAEESDEKKLECFLQMITISTNRFIEVEFKKSEYPPEEVEDDDDFPFV